MRITTETIVKLKKYRLYHILNRAYSVALKIKNRLSTGPVILLYHRVANLDNDPQLLAVTPEHFYEHMEYLKQNHDIVGLNELKSSISSRKLPKNSIAITFDDGYADNFLNAKPVLEKLQIPATIFVVTGQVGSTREFYWDELERLLLLRPSLPKSLRLTIRGKAYFFEIDGSAELTENKGELIYQRWNVTLGFYPTARHRVYTELLRLLRPLDDTERQAILSEIARWAQESSRGRQDYRALSLDEIRDLAGSGLIKIGAHTVTHPVLSVQSSEVQQREIIESKQCLEDIIKQPVTAFSYPYGGWGDVTSETIEFVREAGFEVACAGIASHVNPRSDPFWLPRWTVRDWGGDEFAHRLKGLLS